MNVELKTAEWKDQIFDVFQDHDIKQVFHVPDAGHRRLIELCQKSNSIRTAARSPPRRKAFRSPPARGWAASARCC